MAIVPEGKITDEPCRICARPNPRPSTAQMGPCPVCWGIIVLMLNPQLGVSAEDFFEPDEIALVTEVIEALSR